MMGTGPCEDIEEVGYDPNKVGRFRILTLNWALLNLVDLLSWPMGASIGHSTCFKLISKWNESQGPFRGVYILNGRRHQAEYTFPLSKDIVEKKKMMKILPRWWRGL